MGVQNPRPCLACRDTGWLPFLMHRLGKVMPWAAACRCDVGFYLASSREWDKRNSELKMAGNRPPDIVEPADADLYHDRLTQNQGEADHPNSTLERKRAALAYIVASFGRDPEPIHMVEKILAGERDDVTRTVAKRDRESSSNPFPVMAKRTGMERPA